MTMPPTDLLHLREDLRDFKFAEAMNLLGWNRPATRAAQHLEVGGEPFQLKELARLGGAIIFEVTGGHDPATLPDEVTRQKVSGKVQELAREHVLVFVDAGRSQSHWFWVKRELKEGAKTLRPQPRTHTYVRGQPDDLFISKLAGLFVDIGELDESGNIQITEVASRLSRALDSEVVVKKFYNEFKDKRLDFAGAIEGIADERERAWYASVMLNRLMFVYFLQRKGFLGGGSLNEQQRRDYLAAHLNLSRQRGENRYYPEFLKALFFEAFAKPEAERDPAARTLTGQIPYLNGGLFLPHPIEKRWPQAFIPDHAFDGILELFGRYDWNLSDLDKHAGGLDPDVLGHIFEKYINQKGFGAYYTRPEITEYLCEQTVRRLVLEKINARKRPGEKPDTNLSDALTRADAGLTRVLLMQELPSLSLLDPACGSGAFLVAALKTLLDVYTTLIGRIHSFNDPSLNEWLRERQGQHPNANYNLKKQIITQNLYGVDLMEEAAEIAKLRLFLSLVSSAQTLDDLEPLPNIDFNLLTGNSLVGLLDVDESKYDSARSGSKGQAVLLGVGAVSYRDIVEKRRRDLANYRASAQMKMENLTALRDQIQADKEKAYETLNALLHKDFHDMKIKYEQATWDAASGKPGKSTKRDLTLADIEALKPFHWAYEFAEVMERGGFDAIIANPPWDVWEAEEKEFARLHDSSIQKNKISDEEWQSKKKEIWGRPGVLDEWLDFASSYGHTSAYFKKSPQYENNISIVKGRNVGGKSNLFALFTELSYRLLREDGFAGLVIPSGIYTDQGMTQLRRLLLGHTKITGLFGFENRRGIFEGVDSRDKFVVLTFSKGGVTESFPAVFMKTEVKDLLDFPENSIDISAAFLNSVSPDTLSIPEIYSEIDKDIIKKVSQFPRLDDEDQEWYFWLSQEFNMTSAKPLFKPHVSPSRLPLIKGANIHQFTDEFAEAEIFIEESEGRAKIIGKRGEDLGQSLAYQNFRLAHRRIARNTDTRTIISTVLPRNRFCGDTAQVVRNDVLPEFSLYACALFNSFFVDYEIRKIVTKHCDAHFMYTLRIPRLTASSPDFLPIAQAAARLICTAPVFDELAVAAGLRGSVDGVTDEAGRTALRAELDGRVAHLYGLSESEFTHILGTFPLVAQSVKDAALQAFRDLAPPAGDPELARLSRLGESATLEYKSSLRTPVNGDAATPELQKALEAVIVKEVAAFLNAGGGTLLIGLDDTGRALGLEPDYASSPKIKDKDGFERHLRGLLGRELGAAAAAGLNVSFGVLDGHELCRVDIPKGALETYVQVADKSGQKHHAFYLRQGNKAEEVPSGPELSKYVRGRWPG